VPGAGDEPPPFSPLLVGLGEVDPPGDGEGEVVGDVEGELSGDAAGEGDETGVAAGLGLGVGYGVGLLNSSTVTTAGALVAFALRPLPTWLASTRAR